MTLVVYKYDDSIGLRFNEIKPYYLYKKIDDTVITFLTAGNLDMFSRDVESIQKEQVLLDLHLLLFFTLRNN